MESGWLRNHRISRMNIITVARILGDREIIDPIISIPSMRAGEAVSGRGVVLDPPCRPE